MKKDRGIKKVLLKEHIHLSDTFHQKTMEIVLENVKRKERQFYVITLSLVTFVSVLMLGGIIFYINTYLDYQLFSKYSLIEFFNKTADYNFSIFVLFLVLSLLLFDSFLRKVFKGKLSK